MKKLNFKKSVLTILLFLIFVPCIFSQTHIYSLENKNSKWTKSGSPFIVHNDIVLKNNLKIEPGVKVMFDNNAKITIDETGILMAKGAINDSIIFTSYDTTGFYSNKNNNGGWQGIELKQTNSNMENQW